MRRTILWLLLGAILISQFAACGRSGEGQQMPTEPEAWRTYFLSKADSVTVEDGTVTFLDGTGEARTLPTGLGNVAILYASFTTLWYEAGGAVSGCLGGDAAVELYREQIGRDITADEGVQILADSAQAKRWDMERILSAHPDVVICSTAMSGYATLEAPARAAGIPVVVVDYDDFADYLKWFKVFCHLTGHPELWESVALAALDEVVACLTACPVDQTPQVLSLFTGADSLKVNTSATVLGGMLRVLGASNVMDCLGGTDAQHAVLNLEAVLAADPDMILIQCHTGEQTARELVERLYGADPVWQSLRAVREGRVYYLEKTLFHNKPNRRFADAYAALAACLYPTG